MQHPTSLAQRDGAAPPIPHLATAVAGLTRVVARPKACLALPGPLPSTCGGRWCVRTALPVLGRVPAQRIRALHIGTHRPTTHQFLSSQGEAGRSQARNSSARSPCAWRRQRPPCTQCCMHACMHGASCKRRRRAELQQHAHTESAQLATLALTHNGLAASVLVPCPRRPACCCWRCWWWWCCQPPADRWHRLQSC